ncbi:MAG: hypothetical protein A2293_04900 [Elusimicrobia bacterium RIFOXYB2_FULL_49_7]|nr:MAG: hypothetical protein A2293_04900 [Elusimicrobia bacterium RIFOXYB2_FULL_49_7]
MQNRDTNSNEPVQQINEEELLKRLRSGDKKAFRLLFEQQRSLIENVSWRILRNREAVKDVSQEILLRVYRGISKFNGKSRLSTWIYRITMNESFRYIEKNKAKLQSLDKMAELASDEHCALSLAIRGQEEELVKRFVEELEPEFKTVLVMFYFGSMRLEEIAAALNVPQGTVNSRIARARDAIREKLRKEIPECI